MLLRLKSIIAGTAIAALCPGMITDLRKAAEQKRPRPGESAEPQERRKERGAILTPSALKTAQEAAQRAGETVPAFVSRAVDIQSKRDKIMQGLKTTQEEGE